MPKKTNHAMQQTILRPKQALNKAYLRSKTTRTHIEGFKNALRTLLDSIDLNESEEHVKNHLRDFLKATFYDRYGLNTKGKTDLVIHTGTDTKSPAGVLLEVKRPTNKADMPTADSLNYKAMHELVLYYLRERIEHKNNDLKQLIITSVHEWFVFDALEFDRLFYRNGQLRKDFTDWSQGKKSGNSTEFFYKEIVAPFIAGLADGTIVYTYFNLKEYEKPLRNQDLKDDVKLVQLYKLLSPAHLLKEPFANDANSLDPGFYLELLHLIGLEEVKEGGRKLIQRKAKPDSGSLLEAAYQKLKSEDLISGLDNAYSYGSTREEQLFNVALELCITWMNRILFLKLLEAQLASYHHGDKAYVFMRPEKLVEFDDLNELFFDVLAERPHLRSENVRQKYGHIPYLNSSLFETTALEKRTLRISNLKDTSRLPLYPKTVLRDETGKPLGKTQPDMRTLEYLLRFLGSYDFGAEGKEEIQEENKTLITASVLGLIFEKINGYRDGSFYTPGFITMYMSREAIRRAVVQRFSEKYGWVLGSGPAGITKTGAEQAGYSSTDQAFEALQLHISRNYSIEHLKEYNQLINSLRICDPAVGSGHYLVSALNELIVIKAELRLLLNRQGKPLHYGSIEVQNDELIVTDHHGELFSYVVHQHPDGHRTINPQVQELQEALFHEKQTIIENCLFGVDINPNSVKICRLRLWIELLKNAYYCQEQDMQADADNYSSPVCYANAAGLRDGFTDERSSSSLNTAGKSPLKGSDKFSQLQTLPNIDINIKQGNSLLSRYPLTADLHEAFGKKGHSLQAYRTAVANYKHTNSKEVKKQLVAFLDEIKQGFRTTLANNDPLRRDMAKLRGAIAVMQDPDLFGAKKVDKKQLQKLQAQLQKLEQERADIEANKLYEGAFEWRFEFPEVLDEAGNYKGFDVVIGNPPYGVSFTESESNLYKKSYTSFALRGESYALFIEKAINILKQQGEFGFIIPDTILNLGFTQAIRELILKATILEEVVLLPSKIFDEATVDTILLFFRKTTESENYNEAQVTVKTFNKKDLITTIDMPENKFIASTALWFEQKAFNVQSNSEDLSIINKVDSEFTKLEEFTTMFYGIKVYQVGKGKPAQTAEIRDSKPFTSSNQINEVWKPFFDGKDVGKYILNWKENNWLNYGPWLAEPRVPEKFEDEKILIRKIVGRTLIANYIPYTSYCNTLLFVLKLIPDKAEIKYKPLLGIINSNFIGWYFRKKFQISNEDTFPQIMIRDILQFAVPNVDNEVTATITSLVEQILTIKQADAAADTSGLEAEIDVLVYRLYNLTYQEVLLVDPAFALSEEEYNQRTVAAQV
ncbi:N-6 DNA methylase [Pontibacter sp. Tf4]|uniref:DUF7149 domain-containing protein n=1 Tax=Pontibacter sp. Tf4 TaxID=2761620 RepID=UPI001623E22E|nr:N-6 DNA methylase [Pontibacter sp. Tf4]MBB6612684.1 N-6 DNA methylase [Pontibacter sp. Tf4]